MNTASLNPNPVRLTSTASDDALLAAIASGDRAALGLLYARHADALRAAAVSALPKHDDTSADDAVQQVFLLLLEGRAGAFQPARGKALAWLKGIVRREAALLVPPPTVPLVQKKRKRGAS
jgi:hypothetical protein